MIRMLVEAEADAARPCHTGGVEESYRKQRRPAEIGSIPDVLQMFTREVRFYREIAPSINVRVPACRRAEIAADGATRLDLEDLSAWRLGADPEAAAGTLRLLHDRWEVEAGRRWAWLPRADVTHLVDALFTRSWTEGRHRRDLSSRVRDLGDRLVGRVAEVEHRASVAAPLTLTHGDASSLNLRTSPDGEIALLDWEDVGLGPGVTDLAWHLVSSVDPASWDDALASYGPHDGLAACLPAAAIQACLSLLDEPEDAVSVAGWVSRLEEVARRI
ncbi:phosphotransferase family protein [Microlunatus sp. GCM10028923]|uniref:phosphotransferase family protein n=1 Tax=Microlunatus sp. GCM10028923 TaxID=3273400 RepID=UPI003621A1FB